MNLWIVAGLASLCAVAHFGSKWWIRRFFRRELEEFQKQFPHLCPICSLKRYGYQFGFEKDLIPEPHACIERLCDDCGAADWPFIVKGDHHGGTKRVCADRDACHRRSPR